MCAAMIPASQLRTGMAIQFEGHPWKVLAAGYHPGHGKMGGVSHARLLNLDTGTQWEHSFRADYRLDDLPVERKAVQFLFEDAGQAVFMDLATAEQHEVPLLLLGERAALLVPEMMVSIEFLGERLVSVVLPDFLELTILDTAPPLHVGGSDATWKPARLENGLEIQVPSFLKTGDSVRVDLNSLRYMDRAKGTAKSTGWR